tara:strand:- start:2576 stop:5920 length:3345 start_codon:yes stop_codon:yes gene_type:complete
MSYTASYIVNSSSAQGTTDFQFTFPYIKEEHIEVYLNYSKITQGSGSNQYQVITNVSPKLIRLNTGIASANLRVEVRRNSSLGTPLVDYADGSTLTANDLDTSSLQSLYIDQELKDNQSRTVVVDETTGLPELNNQKLTNVADPTAAQDAATKNYVDTNDALKVNKAGDTMSGALAMGTNKVTGVGDPTAAQDVVTKAYLERTGSITSTQILDGTIVNADINASAAISGSKVQLASGSGPGALSTSDFVKLSNIETAATADQTDAEIRTAVGNATDSNVFTDALKNKLDGIDTGAKDDQTAAEIRTLVENATDSNVFTDDDHTKLNGIETAATADQTDAEIRAAVENATDSNVFTDADHSKLNGIETAATADQTASEIKTLLQSDKLTSSEIATGALDGRYYTETEVDANFYKLGSVGEIQSGETWSAADNKIATTAAIDARITDLVDDVGGFVPIANETSFPTANPDINNGAGTLVSIKEFASSHTPSGGSVTIANGAGSGNTVTITGCGSTVLAAGFGGIVETTSTLHTYTFHRLSPKATEITTVAGSISNINTVGGSITNVNTVAGNNSNITTVAGVSSNVTTVAGISANVTTVAGIAANITTVAGVSSDVTAVAGKATEVGRLGTADAVADLNTLGTTAIVSDLDTCATNISNINTVGGSISNVNTVASNMSTVNDFADRYRVASSAPSSNNDEGDLYFDTTSNELRVYNGSTWQGGVTATGNLAGLGANTFTGVQTFVSTQTFDGRDVSADGTKLDGIEANATADQTAAEIRTLVDNASDCNVFTDANNTKLNGIETGATADQTDAEIRTAVENATDSNVFTDADHTKLNGIEAGATADQTATEIRAAVEAGDLSSLSVDGDVTFAGDSNKDMVWDKSDGALELATGANITLADSNIIRFVNGSSGTSGGNEGIMFGASGSELLKIFNWGSTGSSAKSRFESGTAQGFEFKGAAFNVRNNVPNDIIYSDGAYVKLYFSDGTNSAEKLATSSAGVSVTGTCTATTFSGSGASLTSLPAGQLTGTVADARLSTVSSSKLSGALPALDGSALTGIQAGATGGGNDAIFHENEHTVTTNYTISSGKNAVSAGDISINNNISVTVPANRSWVVL